MRRLLLVVLIVLCAGLSLAQGNQPTEPLLAQLAILESETGDIRGITLNDATIERLFPTRDDVLAFLTTQFEEDGVPEYYRDTALVYHAFDLLPADIDLIVVLSELMVQQIGGYYDPETKHMNTLMIGGDALGDRLPLLEQTIYVHEFTHAIQDANFDLGALLGGEENIEFVSQYPDAALARSALAEGDATEVMARYMTYATETRPQDVLQDMGALMTLSATTQIPPGTPKILEQELMFPYLQGQSFVQALLAEGGWERVNEAYANPPASTEHIIHPASYLAGDMPHDVAAADVIDAFEEDGWAERFNRTAGEFFLRRYLETQLGLLDVSRAASGWGGDSYRFYATDAGDVAWVWQLSWDTPEDSEQFFSAIIKFAGLRYPDAVNDSLNCWANDADAMCVADLNGETLITRAPTITQAKVMREIASIPQPVN